MISCYFTLWEYKDAATSYVDTLTTWRKILYNLAHNLGEIYDLTYEIVKRFINYEENIKKIFFWDRLGWAIGTLFNDVLEQPDDFEPYVPSMHEDNDERRGFDED
jgi:hypothetical protein